MPTQSNLVGFNPSDSLQQSFLSALALGETGPSSTNAWLEGTGGTNLSGASTDSFGFPQWQGVGNSTAAGVFQFTGTTWDNIAQQFNLNFQNPEDQEEGAWYLAQQTYAQNTGGQSLEAALQAGNYSSIQSALSGVWPSVTGNGANPQGLAAALQAGTGADLTTPGGGSGSGNTPVSSSNSLSGADLSSSTGGPLGAIQQFLVRGGLIIVGGIIVIVALWQILSSRGIVPSPADTAKGVGDTVKSAATAAVAAA